MTRDPAQATPNRAPSSSAKLTTPTGRAGHEAVVPQLVDRRERPDDTERAVEGPTVGHRVEVRADDDAGVAGGDRGIRVAPPGPLVAHPVGREVEPTVGALAGEPLAQVVVLAGPGEAVVAPAVVVEAQGLEVVPHPPEPRGGPAEAVASWTWLHLIVSVLPWARTYGVIVSAPRRWAAGPTLGR